MATPRLLALIPLLVVAAVQGQDRVVPNDPYFPYQVAFGDTAGPVSTPVSSFDRRQLEAKVRAGVPLDLPHAWAITTGSHAVVVAILDDGFFYSHEDVAGNIWHNPGETGLDADGRPKELNGKDDDGNGYVDDVIGWDFAFDDPDPDPYVFDGMDRSRVQPYWHSISAMGIIGAVGNNGIGVAGINWSVSLMLLKVGAQGIPRGQVDTLRPERLARAIRYAADNGARVINISQFIQDLRPAKVGALRAAIEYAGTKNVLVVNGAGNDARDIDVDANCYYPECFELDNLVKVAEVDFDGSLYRQDIPGKAVGSNWGVRRVQVAAIGQLFTASLRNNLSTYSVSGGTSSTGPVVAGVAALVLSVRPDLTTNQLRQVLCESVTPVPALRDKIECGGVVNAYRAMQAALNLPRR